MKTKVLHSFSSTSIASCSTVAENSIRNFNKNPDGNNENSYNEQVGDNQSDNVKYRYVCRPRIRDFCRRTFQKENIRRVLPILQWAPKYNSHKLISDIIAGLTVGLTILPQGLAYATVAGLPPVYGLYSGFVGPFVYILFGSSKVITIGPNAIQCILTYKYTHGKPPEYAVFLCFICGVVNLCMAFLRLGFISNFISQPVISGFTSAIALSIVATQINGLLGLNMPDAGFLSTFVGLFQNISDVKAWDALLGLICCVTLLLFMNIQFLFRCFTKENPNWQKIFWLIATSRNAIIITTCTVIAAILSSPPFTLVGHLVPGLPEFKPPPFTIFDPTTNVTNSFGDIVREEASALFILPLLGLMGHITIAKAFAGSTRVDATQEVLAIGISNAVSCFFSSMPIAGSFSRTTVNAFSGAETPAGGFVTGIMVILALQFLTPYFYFIPKTSLAAVVCTSVIFMVDFRILKPLWKSKKMDLLPWGLTFFTTLFVGLEYGIITGLGISAIFLLYYAARPRVKIMKGLTTEEAEFILIELDRSLTYPSMDYITDIIMKSIMRWGNNSTPIVLDCHHIQFADFTAAQALRNMVNSLEKDNYKIIFWQVKPSVLRVMNGIMEDSHIPFTHCSTEKEMEAAVDGMKWMTTVPEEIQLTDTGSAA